MDRDWNIAIAGIGNIGHALLDHININQPGFRIVCAFDQDSSLVGTNVRGVTVHSLEEI